MGASTRTCGTPAPPRPSAHRLATPARIPSPMPPTTSRGRWTPAYIRPNATVPAAATGTTRQRPRVSDASAVASANATAECPDTYPSPVARSRTRTRASSVDRSAPRGDVLHRLGAPVRALAGEQRRRGETRAPGDAGGHACDEQRSDEAPELHRYPHDRPQRIRQPVQCREHPALGAGDVVGGGDHRPTPREQHRATDRGDGLAVANAATSDR